MTDIRKRLEADMEKFFGAGGKVQQVTSADNTERCTRRTRAQQLAHEKRRITAKHYPHQERKQ